MEIDSTAFKHGGIIPLKYTCDGVNVSPPLSWSHFPKDTKSFALICDDPDAPMGTWVHWVIYDIPVVITQLPENVAPQREPVQGGKQGTNDFRKIGYGGPCPPGGEHRYYFKLYAMDGMTNLKSGVTTEQLLRTMKGHILAEAQLIGKYRR